jgi:hypothetical protein
MLWISARLDPPCDGASSHHLHIVASLKQGGSGNFELRGVDRGADFFSSVQKALYIIKCIRDEAHIFIY